MAGSVTIPYGRADSTPPPRPPKPPWDWQTFVIFYIIFFPIVYLVVSGILDAIRAGM